MITVIKTIGKYLVGDASIDLVKSAIINLGKKTVTVLAFVGLSCFLLSLIPFELRFPDELMEVFKSSWFINLMQTITFFFPVNYAFKCLVVLFIAKHLGFIVSFFKHIYNVISGGLSS